MQWSWLGLGVGLGIGIAALIGFALWNGRRWSRSRASWEKQAATLVELDRVRDQLIAITSHEIRGPLTAMITGIETIRRRDDELDPERRTRVLEMLMQQAKQLARLVDDLTLSSEVESGELSIDAHMTELEPAIQRALEAATPKRRNHQLELFIEPVRCEIDADRISQMMRNLIENAFKYTPDHSRVTVAGRAVQGGIEIEVADDGPGIPLDRRDKLFEAFSRMEETAAGTSGVGLGLYVVSRLAAAMDARLDMSSSSRGTTFTIQIPCRVEQIDHPRMGIISGTSEGEGI